MVEKGVHKANVPVEIRDEAQAIHTLVSAIHGDIHRVEGAFPQFSTGYQQIKEK